MDAGARLENAWADLGSVGSNPTSFATINRNLVPLKDLDFRNYRKAIKEVLKKK